MVLSIAIICTLLKEFKYCFSITINISICTRLNSLTHAYVILIEQMTIYHLFPQKSFQA